VGKCLFALAQTQMPNGAMLPTMELRWFFAGTVPQDVLIWFLQAERQTAEPLPRVDHYLYIVEADTLGIKLREGRIEIKRRQHQSGPVRLHEWVSGVVEHWRKWSFALAGDSDELAGIALPGSGWIAVHKERRLSRYRITGDGALTAVPASQYPEMGCDLELTQVRIARDLWWTMALEAFGDEALLQEQLYLAGRKLLAEAEPPALPFEGSYSYPRWLQIVAGQHAHGTFDPVFGH
jgi:hypothetical protein